MNTREIKFRVYNTKTKQWVHGPNYEVNLFGECILLGAFMNKVPVLELNDCVPLQYTGLTDKNGKEIYEGDIIKFSRLFEIEHKVKELTSYIRFDEGKFGFDLVGFNGMFYDLSDDHNIEVIGNIHENSKLLK